MQMTNVLLLLSLAACGFAYKRSDLPSFIECTSNNDCNPGYCCSIGREKYSYPTCKLLQAKDEVCRPSSPVTSETLYYPDGLNVTLNNVLYLILCPCAEGLVCDRVDGQCHEA